MKDWNEGQCQDNIYICLKGLLELIKMINQIKDVLNAMLPLPPSKTKVGL